MVAHSTGIYDISSQYLVAGFLFILLRIVNALAAGAPTRAHRPTDIHKHRLPVMDSAHAAANICGIQISTVGDELVRIRTRISRSIASTCELFHYSAYLQVTLSPERSLLVEGVLSIRSPSWRIHKNMCRSRFELSVVTLCANALL